MTFFHAMKGSAQEAAASKSPAAICRTLYTLEEKVATFTTLVPWPALAASFQDDVNFLRSINEPQDCQSPPCR